MKREPQPRKLVDVVAGSGIGIVERQFRVQYQPSASLWHLYGSFRDRADADECLEQLQVRGYRARIVELRHAPAAA